MATIRLIADDLTGALDAAVQFTGAVPGFPVLLDHDVHRVLPEATTSAAISTSSRDLDAASAAARIAAAAPFVEGADIAFLKIDSLLRGHWPADLAALLAAYPGHVCGFAPAFPAQRRIMRNGRQYAPGPDGIMTALDPVPAAALAAAGCRTRSVPADRRAIDPLAAEPGTVFICDATDQDDLDRLATAARKIDAPILWCGSAGLARALAAGGPRCVRPAPARPLVIAGSAHPVTLAQIAAVPPAAARRVTLGADSTRAAARITHDLAAMACLVTVDVPPGTPNARAARVIAARLGATLPQLAPPRSLVVIGGETLAAVCHAVGADALQLDGEYAPGVPCSRLGGGIWDGVPLLSRSGAFGGAEFLANLLAAG